MKVGIVGAGAVGCYYGFRLVYAGAPVIFVAKAEHAGVIRNAGVVCETRHRPGRCYPTVSTDFSVLEKVDVVLVCVKACDTDRVAVELAPYIRKDTQVLSLQNGVDTAERMGRLMGKAVSPIILYTATELIAPGHVIHHGGNEVILGQDLRHSDISALFSRGGFSVQFCDNIPRALWEKLAVNCACNALSAILRKPYRDFLNTERLKPTLWALVEECRTVANRFAISLPRPELLLDRVFNLSRVMPTQYSSMAHDLMKGKKTEVDALNGFVVRTGEALGIATPVNRLLWDMVTLLSEHIPSSTQNQSVLDPVFPGIFVKGEGL